MTRLAIFLTSLVLSLFAVSTAHAARTEFFGIVQGQFDADGQLDNRDLKRMAAEGIRTERFELGWKMVEPTRGSYSWGGSDRFIGALASHGIRPVPFVWGSPDWVATNPGRPPIDTLGHQQAWRSFLKAAVARYGPGGSYWANGYRQQFGASATPLPIQSWQVWNEPNLKKFFDPGGSNDKSAKKYARLLRMSHDAIKSKDPQAQIILAGNPGYPPGGGLKAWDFLANLYHVAGIRSYFDAAALHPYASDLYHVKLEIQKVRNVMVSHGDQATPLWLTELGWGSDPPDRFGINQGLQGQRQMLTGAFRMILNNRSAWNVQRLYWFMWRDPPPGSAFAHRCSFCASAGVLRSNRTEKPAYSAFTGFTAETTPPVPKITSGPRQGTFIKNPTPTFKFSSNEPGSTFECRFDGTPYASCDPPYTLPQLTDGAHHFFLKAIDAPGNESGVRSRSFTVDTIAPTVTISSGPANGSSSSDTSPSFGFASDESGASLDCQLDGGGFAPCSSPFTASGLADGSHTFQARATDRAGNRGSAFSTWTVDTVPPAVTISSGPADGSTSSNRNPSFGFTSNEPGSQFQCELDGGAFAPCSSPYKARRLGDGPHTFGVEATDPAGNTGSAVSTAWTVDAPPPVVQITSAPGSATNDSTPSFAFSSSDSAAAFRCRLDGASFAPCASPFTTPALAEGQHSFEVKAIDGMKQSVVRSRSFTVDTIAPGVTISSGPTDGSSSPDRTPSFRFAATEPDSHFRCRTDGHRFAPCSSPYATRRLADGRHLFGVRAIDQAGNLGDPLEVGFRVDTQAPRVRIRGPRRVRTDRRRAAITFRVRAPKRVWLRCRIDSRHARPCSPRYRTPELRRGRHTLKVKAIDRAGNVGAKRKRFRIVGIGS